MPISPPVNPPAPLTYRVLDLIQDAFIEIGACPPGEIPSPDEQQWGFRKLNDLMDEWQARKPFVYSYVYDVYTLVPGLLPHTIGPSGIATFSTNGQPRPVRLESSALLLNTSPGQVDFLMNIRDHAWWAENQVKQISTSVPTDVYYDPTSPDGQLYFWPVPNANYQVRLQWWQTVSQFVGIQDPIGGPGGPLTMPPGYRPAMKLSLAEMLIPGSNRQIDPVLVRRAAEARKGIFSANDKSPRMKTQDSGMPKGRGGYRADFNWATGGAPGGAPE